MIYQPTVYGVQVQLLHKAALITPRYVIDSAMWYIGHTWLSGQSASSTDD